MLVSRTVTATFLRRRLTIRAVASMIRLATILPATDGRPTSFRCENDSMVDEPEADDEGEETPDHMQQEFQFQPVSARVPERVARGVFSTGAIVLQGPDEFVIDFILKLAHPHQVVARIVLPTPVIPRFIAALEENLRIYERKYGTIPLMPQLKEPPAEPQIESIEELYAQLKLSDEMLSGCYANAVMIGHEPAEYFFDFITNIYPRSVVSARVFMAAPQAPALYDVLSRTWKKFLETRAEQPLADEEDETDDRDDEELNDDEESND